MKKGLLFTCFCILLFAGCHTPKKIASNTTENIKTNEKQNEASTTETYSFLDTAKKSGIEINYFKIEFYPPAGPEDVPDTIPDNSTLPVGLSGNAGSNPIAKPPNSQTGAIKSIEGYIIKANSEESGVKENKENTQVNRNEEKNEDINRQEEIKEQPAADPYRWRYILGICIVVILAGVGLYFGFRKSKFVISIVSFLKKLF